jgi:hypothetical protein
MSSCIQFIEEPETPPCGTCVAADRAFGANRGWVGDRQPCGVRVEEASKGRVCDHSPVTSKQSVLSFHHMRFQPATTFEQFRDTCQAVSSARTKHFRHRSWRENVLLGVVCLVFGLAAQVPVARVAAITLFAVMVLFWILSKPIGKRSRERWLRDLYAEEQTWLNEQVLTIDESGISSDHVNGLVTSHHRWQAFTKRIDMPDAFVFLSSPNHFIRVPKDALSSSDREHVLHWSSTVPTGDV